jgi:serine/threonine-protein kinase
VHVARTDNERLGLAMSRPARAIASVLPHLSPPLARVIDRSLSYEREQRWQSAADFREALRRAVSVGPASRAAVSDGDATVRGAAPVRPGRTRWTAMTLAVVSLAGLGAWAALRPAAHGGPPAATPTATATATPPSAAAAAPAATVATAATAVRATTLARETLAPADSAPADHPRQEQGRASPGSALRPTGTAVRTRRPGNVPGVPAAAPAPPTPAPASTRRRLDEHLLDDRVGHPALPARPAGDRRPRVDQLLDRRE